MQDESFFLQYAAASEDFEAPPDRQQGDYATPRALKLAQQLDVQNFFADYAKESERFASEAEQQKEVVVATRREADAYYDLRSQGIDKLKAGEAIGLHPDRMNDLEYHRYGVEDERKLTSIRESFTNKEGKLDFWSNVKIGSVQGLNNLRSLRENLRSWFSEEAPGNRAKVREYLFDLDRAVTEEDMPWQHKAARGVAATATGNVLPALATGPAAVPASIGLAIAGTVDEAAYEADRVGLTGSKRASYIATQGVIEGAVTIAMQKLGLGGMESSVKALITGQSLRKTLGESVKAFGKQTLAELAEEEIIAVGHAATETIWRVQPDALSQLPQTMLDTGIVTIATMGALKGTHVVTSSGLKMMSDKGQQDLTRGLQAVAPDDALVNQHVLESPPEALRTKQTELAETTKKLREQEDAAGITPEVVAKMTDELDKSVAKLNKKVAEETGVPTAEGKARGEARPDEPTQADLELLAGWPMPKGEPKSAADMTPKELQAVLDKAGATEAAPLAEAAGAETKSLVAMVKTILSAKQAATGESEADKAEAYAAERKKELNREWVNNPWSAVRWALNKPATAAALIETRGHATDFADADLPDMEKVPGAAAARADFLSRVKAVTSLPDHHRSIVQQFLESYGPPTAEFALSDRWQLLPKNNPDIATAKNVELFTSPWGILVRSRPDGEPPLPPDTRHAIPLAPTARKLLSPDPAVEAAQQALSEAQLADKRQEEIAALPGIERTVEPTSPADEADAAKKGGRSDKGELETAAPPVPSAPPASPAVTHAQVLAFASVGNTGMLTIRKTRDGKTTESFDSTEWLSTEWSDADLAAAKVQALDNGHLEISEPNGTTWDIAHRPRSKPKVASDPQVADPLVPKGDQYETGAEAVAKFQAAIPEKGEVTVDVDGPIGRVTKTDKKTGEATTKNPAAWSEGKGFVGDMLALVQNEGGTAVFDGKALFVTDPRIGTTWRLTPNAAPASALDSMNILELRREGKRLGVESPTKLNKTDLLDAIRAAGPKAEPASTAAVSGGEVLVDGQGPVAKFLAGESGALNLDEAKSALKAGGETLSRWFNQALKLDRTLPAGTVRRFQRHTAQAAAEMESVRQTLADFRSAKKAYGTDWTELRDQLFLKAIHGDTAAMASLPADARTIARRMRTHQDTLSRAALATGALDGDVGIAAVANNGFYLHRSYRAFEQPEKWAARARTDADLMARAANFFRKKYPTYTDLQINNAVEDFLVKPMEAARAEVNAKTPLGKLNKKQLLERQELPPTLRELLGEHTDPELVFAKSIQLTSALLARHQFMAETRVLGMGKFLFKENDPARPAGFNHRIADEESMTMGPLAGLYTTKDIADGFYAFGNEEVSDLSRVYYKAASAARLSKTLGDPLSYARNVHGVINSLLTHGVTSLKSLGDAWGVVKTLNAPSSEAGRALVEKLTRLKVLGRGVDAGALADSVNEFSAAGLGDAIEHGASRWWKKVTEGAATAYGSPDAFARAVAWAANRDRYANAYKAAGRAITDEKLDEMAATIVNDTMPDYDALPAAVKFAARSPFLGSFPKWSWEVFRTGANTAKLIAAEIRDPVTRSIGAKRSVGFLASTVLLEEGLRGLAMWLTGSDEEEMRATREAVPEYEKGGFFIPVGRDEKGNLRLVNSSRSMIHSPLRDVAYAVARGEDWSDILMGIVAKPFVQPEILTAAINQAYNNVREDGGRLFNPDDPDFNEKRWKHVGAAFLPGAVTRAKKIGGALIEGDTAKAEREALAAVTGVRSFVADRDRAVTNQAYEFDERRRNVAALWNGTVSRGDSKDHLVATYRESNAKLAVMQMELHNVVKSARTLGSTDDEIRELLTARRLDKETIKGVMAGDTIPLEIGRDDLDRVMRSTPDADLAKEKVAALFEAELDATKDITGGEAALQMRMRKLLASPLPGFNRNRYVSREAWLKDRAQKQREKQLLRAALGR